MNWNAGFIFLAAAFGILIIPTGMFPDLMMGKSKRIIGLAMLILISLCIIFGFLAASGVGRP